jgi:hypothetical protein
MFYFNKQWILKEEIDMEILNEECVLDGEYISLTLRTSELMCLRVSVTNKELKQDYYSQEQIRLFATYYADLWPD